MSKNSEFIITCAINSQGIANNGLKIENGCQTLLLFVIQFWYWIWWIFDLKVKYHKKSEQTNIQIDGRYVTNSNSKLLFIFKACRMGTKFKISTVLFVVGMKY